MATVLTRVPIMPGRSLTLLLQARYQYARERARVSWGSTLPCLVPELSQHASSERHGRGSIAPSESWRCAVGLQLSWVRCSRRRDLDNVEHPYKPDGGTVCRSWSSLRRDDRVSHALERAELL